MPRRAFLIALSVYALGTTLGCGQTTLREEVDHLAKLLDWRAGFVVAEIGAGEGEMTVLAASKYVGAAGRKLYTTELDPKRLAHLEELAAKQKNIIAVRAAEAETNLPPECCHSIFMRLPLHTFLATI